LQLKTELLNTNIAKNCAKIARRSRWSQ